MQRQRGGLPPAPASLPAPPHIFQNTAGHASQYNTMTVPNQGALTAQAVTAALSNPYAQAYSSGYHSSHYAQAYMQYSANGSSWPAANADGYTLSTTYVQGSIPGSSSISNRPTNHSSQYGDKGNRGSHNRASQPAHVFSSHGSWYQFGNARCTYNSCTFTGSQKALEIHMMDRHLIYPPGWEKRKKESDWDADPSLKGKPIPIQGTTIVLDNPEVLDAWIAERKKRWPSANRVDEKKRKREEAVARGQISVDDPALLRGKRPRHDRGLLNTDSHQRENRSERARGRGRSRGRGRGTDGGWRGRGRGGSNLNTRDGPESSHSTPVVLPALQQSMSATQDPDGRSDSDDDGPPEVITSKPPPLISHDLSSCTDQGHDETLENGKSPTSKTQLAPAPSVPSANSQLVKPIKKPRPNQPKKAPYNPFASRPTLLRNLLLPEIRVTVSNLSQAIRFLVDNDFLQGVEMKAGEADEKFIEVIGDSNVPPPTLEDDDTRVDEVGGGGALTSFEVA